VTIVGIVGSEELKFTPIGKMRAIATIVDLLAQPGVTEIVSGDCHLGGIDQWAAEKGRELGLIVTEFPPLVKSWTDGYKPRNLQIANRSDVVHCITVDQLPPNFPGMQFLMCYHCFTRDHVKSGGCWTMKEGLLHVIKNYDEHAMRGEE
jgi:hypothetical protein